MYVLIIKELNGILDVSMPLALFLLFHTEDYCASMEAEAAILIDYKYTT